METYSREFALFIDGIRLERGVARNDLIDGIISLSQYKRYLRGAAPIPNNVVIELADKLKYNITDFYSLFSKKHSKEYNSLMEIYKLMKLGLYENVLIECKKIKYESIVSSFNKLFYDFCLIYTQHKLGRVSNIHVLSIYSDLIDYPSCMNNESYNMIEMNILSQIVVISSTMDNFDPALSLYNIITSRNFDLSYSGETSILPMIYYTTARVFYRQEKFEETLTLAEEGIKFAIKYETMNSLPHLFLVSSLVYKKTERMQLAITTMKKCFLQLAVIGNKDMFNIFLKSYEENFDFPIEDFLCDFSDFM